jgi:hypothetical protein
MVPVPEAASLPASLLRRFARGDPLMLALNMIKQLTTTASGFSRGF